MNRGDLSTKKENPVSESSLPLMMSSPASPHTYTNASDDDENSKSSDAVSMQDIRPTLPVKHSRPIVFSKQRKNSNHNHNNNNDADPSKRGQPVQNGIGHYQGDMVAWGYEVPSSILDHNGVEGEYVEEEDLDDFIVGGTNGYLTPTEFPLSAFHFEKTHPAGRTSPQDDEKTHQRPFNERRVRSNLFDSGVEDCGVSSTSLSIVSACSLSNPRISTNYEQHYEDIDLYSREYKKQKEKEKNAMEMKKNSPEVKNIKPLPCVDLSGTTRSESEDFNEPELSVSTAQIIPPERNERIAECGTLPNTYSRLNIQNGAANPIKRDKEKNYCGCLMICLFFIMSLVSLASLGVSIYVLLSRNNSQISAETSSSPTPSPVNVTYASSQDLQALKSEVEQLKLENVRLKTDLDLYMNNSLSSLQFLENKAAMMEANQVNQSMAFHVITQDLRSEIADISLTPGPRGPQGVGNFSLCQLKSSSVQLGASDIHSTKTTFEPKIEVLEDHIIIFAFCTYSGATFSVLDFKTQSSMVQYKCECSGKVDGFPRTTCTVNLLLCPRLTSQVP